MNWLPRPIQILGVLLFIAMTAYSTWAGQPVPFRIISDIDDTVKITHVQSKPAAVVNGMFGNTALAGMAPLYTELLGNSGQLTFLSGSPTFLRNHLIQFGLENNFPPNELILKKWFAGIETADFKWKNLVKLLESSELPAVLIGDDTEADPEVLDGIAKLYPNKVLAVYIHQVAGRVLPARVIPFVTALDLAMSEHVNGRLSVMGFMTVYLNLQRVHSPELIVPDYAICTAYQLNRGTNADTAIQALYADFQHKLGRYCTQRNDD